MVQENNITNETTSALVKYTVPVDVAVEYGKAGLSVLPASKQQKRPLVAQWKDYQTHQNSEAQIRALWQRFEPDALCIVCGKISGNLEVIDFDNGGELYEAWKQEIPQELFSRLVVERSQSGGYHVVYRCVVEIDGGVKLACGNRNGDVKMLIETRGEGNVILCAPSKGYALLQGDWKSLPIITREEREDLLTAAVELNEAWKECTSSSELDRQEHISFRLRPGDDFNERGRENTRQILEMYGWKPVCVAANGSELWRRPGKDVGVSASLGEKHFYVFSTFRRLPWEVSPRRPSPFWSASPTTIPSPICSSSRATG